MPTINVEAHVSTSELLRAAEQLDAQELEQFVQATLALQAKRKAPAVGHEEAVLLERINQPVPQPLQARYDALVAKRRAETLTPADYQELLQLTDAIEQHAAERVQALVALAQLRGKPLEQLMHDLNITQPSHA